MKTALARLLSAVTGNTSLCQSFLIRSNNAGGGPAVPNFKQMSNEELQQILKRNGHPVPPLLEGQIAEAKGA